MHHHHHHQNMAHQRNILRGAVKKKKKKIQNDGAWILHISLCSILAHAASTLQLLRFRTTCMNSHMKLNLFFCFLFFAIVMSSRSWICHNFSYLHTCLWEIIYTLCRLKKTLQITFSLDTVKARSFKFFMIITLLGIYIFIVDLITFFAWSEVCQKYELQIVLFRFMCTVVLTLYSCYLHF